VDGVAWRRRKDQRPQEILAAARRLIEDEGAAATSMARIAKLAGVSEATVYKYYESKQDLVNQVLIEWAQPFVERLSSELRHITGLRARLTLIAMRFMRSMEETPKLHRVFYQELRWSNYRGTPLHRLNHEFAQSVVITIDAAIKAGEIRQNVDPAMLRDMLFGGLEHIAIRTSFVGKTIDVDAAASSYVDLMLDGLLAKPPEKGGSDEVARLSALLDRMEQRLGSD
jgi:AcrR family transcriptional regulator